MNTRTAGVIVTITFLVALVIIVSLMVEPIKGTGQVARIDSDPLLTTEETHVYTSGEDDAASLKERDNADF